MFLTFNRDLFMKNGQQIRNLRQKVGLGVSCWLLDKRYVQTLTIRVRRLLSSRMPVAYAYTHRFLGAMSGYPNGFSIRLQFYKAMAFEMSIG